MLFWWVCAEFRPSLRIAFDTPTFGPLRPPECRMPPWSEIYGTFCLHIDVKVPYIYGQSGIFQGCSLTGRVKCREPGRAESMSCHRTRSVRNAKPHDPTRPDPTRSMRIRKLPDLTRRLGSWPAKSPGSLEKSAVPVPETNWCGRGIIVFISGVW